MVQSVIFVEIRHLLSRHDADLHRAILGAARHEDPGALRRQALDRLLRFQGEMAAKYALRVNRDRVFTPLHCPSCFAVWNPLERCRICGQSAEGPAHADPDQDAEVGRSSGRIALDEERA